MRVGVVDTGIDQTHPDLSGKTVACATLQRCLTRSRRASAPTTTTTARTWAGTIAAKANNGIGVAGVAFNADLVVCKALDEFGSGSARRRGQLHRLGRLAGRQGDLDEPRGRRVDDDAERGRERRGTTATAR